MSFFLKHFFSLAFDGTDEVTTNIFTLYTLDVVNHIPPAWQEHQVSSARKYLQNGANFKKWKEDPGLALLIYTQLAREFGWDSYKSVFRYYESAQPKLSTDQEKIDYWIEIFSHQVKRNLVPLFKFWGIPISASTVNNLTSLKTPVISDELIQIAPDRYSAGDQGKRFNTGHFCGDLTLVECKKNIFVFLFRRVETFSLFQEIP